VSTESTEATPGSPDDAGVESLRSVMRTMRAMRRLRPDPVPRELLVELLEAATWAPTGSNTQGYTFVVVTEREQMRRIAPAWRRGMGLYLETFGRSAPPPTMRPDAFERMVSAIRFQLDHFEETPALVVACYELHPLRNLRVSWGSWVSALRTLGLRDAGKLALHARRTGLLGEAGSIYPALQNLLLLARARGLGATLTAPNLLVESELRAALDIPRGVSIHALVPIGWPRGRFGPVRRRPVAEVVRWERW